MLQIEVGKLQKELNTLRGVKDEIELIAKNLQSEVDNINTKYGELNRFLLEDELEKEMLRKQVIQLIDDVKMREDILSMVDKEMKEKNCQDHQSWRLMKIEMLN